MGIEDMVLQDSRKSIRTDAGQEGDDEACKEGVSKIRTSGGQAGEKESETGSTGLCIVKKERVQVRDPDHLAWNRGTKEPIRDLMCLFYRLYQDPQAVALLVSNWSSPSGRQPATLHFVTSLPFHTIDVSLLLLSDRGSPPLVSTYTGYPASF